MEAYQYQEEQPVTGAVIWPGFIGIVVVFALASLFVVPSYVAYTAGYQTALGDPIVAVFGWRLYGPGSLSLWVWNYAFIEALRPVWIAALWLFAEILIAGVLTAVLWIIHRGLRSSRKSGLYGTAAWATRKDVKPFLRHSWGITFGGWKD